MARALASGTLKSTLVKGGAAVDYYLRLDFDTWRIDHEQRVRDALRHYRAKEARAGVNRSAAAQKERRFFVFRPFAPSRPREA
jgi:hypothetical protein